MALTLYPTSGQSLDETRDPIRNNFSYIQDGFIANHVELNSGANSGKHTATNFIQLASDPTALSTPKATLANEIMLYAKADATTTGGTGIFLMGPLIATPFSITGATKVAANSSNGWTYLPSGLILKWGVITINAAPTPYLFAPAFSQYCLNISLTNINPGSQVNIVQVVAGTLTKDGVTVESHKRTTGFEATTAYFFAIGY